MGIGNTTNRNLPVAVSTTGALADKTVIAVAAGSSHSLALCRDGTLAAWGYNFNGQLGNASTTASTLPVAVSRTGILADKTVVAVAVGDSHTLALCADGTLVAWGYNPYGQLGNGSTVQSTVPVAVNTTGVLSGKTVVAISAGSSHSVALCADGTLAAWGYNSNGQLGNGNKTNSNVPVAVDQSALLSGRVVIAVSAGSSHCLALCADGRLAAWGQNFYGALGNGTTTDSPVPVAVSMAGALAGKQVVSVSGGSSRSLALCSDGTLAAWGTNDHGQAGNGSIWSSNMPVAVNTDTLGFGEKFTVGIGAQSASHSLGIVAAPCLPMLALEQPGGMRLSSGRSTVDFGSTPSGNGVSKTFTIRNDGFLPLAIDSVTLDGSNAAEFVLTTPPAASVAPGSTTAFTVAFTAGAPFNRRAALHIASNDPITSVFQVDLAATCRGVLTAVYNTGLEVPLSIGGFTAAGSTVDFTLNHAPATGTQLMVVRNTGLNFISGTFGNLAQGQVVVLSYGGTPYSFVANYYGGSGNDLVLQWAATRPFAWGSNSSGVLGNGSTTQSNLPVKVNMTGVFAGKTLAGVAAGGSHTLALGMDGTLAAWGNNDNGQLGNGNTASSTVPLAVNTAGALSGKTVIAVDAGNSHSLALCSDGTLAAWGYNSSGQLGNGSTTSSSVPVAVNTAGVLAGKTVVAMAGGGSHSLALCSDGTLAAWGYNYYGQLGNGGTSQSSVPVAVNTAGALAGKAVIALAAGYSFSLALCSDGTLTAWGYNNNGQLGIGSTAQANVPVTVSMAGALADKTIVAVAAGSSHVMALCADGTLAAWGSNSSGQLGNGNTTSSSVPVAVSKVGVLSGKTLVAVAAGDSHSLALCADGALAAWGQNYWGQLGNGTSTSSNVPVEVNRAVLTAGEIFVATINASGDSSIGLVATPYAPRLVVQQPSGTALTGGRGTVDLGSSDLGTGVARTFTIRNDGNVPLTIDSVTIDGANAADFILTTPPAASVTPGATTTFVVTFTTATQFARSAALHITSNDSTTGTFHVNLTATGQGLLTATYQTGAEVPLTTNGFTATGSRVNLTLNHAPATGAKLTVVKNTGMSFINGNFSNLTQGQVVALSYGGVSYTFVANYYGGSGKDLVLQWATTRPYAWGRNTNGQLGNGGTMQSIAPVAVSTSGVLAGKTVIAVATGDSHSLALCADGTLAAWGYNYFGQLGDGTTASSYLPVAVNTAGALAGKTVIAVAAGSNHSLVLCSDGTLAAWGTYSSGQLGNGGAPFGNLPVAVSMTGILAGKTVMAVAAGGAHSLALCTDGTLVAWGANSSGQLGNGSTTSSNVPVEVSTAGVLANKTITAVSAGNSHSLALCADGTLAAWGDNYSGQLGDGTTASSSLPVAVRTTGVLAGKTITAAAAGYTHSLALCADGSLVAWGSDEWGSLGDNAMTGNSHVPVLVDQTGALSGKAVRTVAAGRSFSMVLCADGTMATWGTNEYGMLGSGSADSSISLPCAVTMAYGGAGEIFVAGASGQFSSHNLGIAAVPPPPQIAVEQPAGAGLISGNSTVDFAGVFKGAATSLTFTLKNQRGGPLTVTSVTFDGANGSDYYLSQAPVPTLGGTNSTFVVSFAPAALGDRNAVMHIASNDPLTSPFDVNLTGTGGADSILNASYATGSEATLVTDSFTATGATVNFTLDFAPTAGAQLMVVNNTGLGFIRGRFANLVQGQNVALAFAGNTYNFVANYYGGSGNDLVLQWAAARPVAWGNNAYGQLGNDSTARSSVPFEVKTSGVLATKTIIAVATGSSHSLALCADSAVATWGYNTYGQLGCGNATSSTTPVAVNTAGVLAGKTVVAVTAGAYHSLALCSDGTLATWGSNSNSQLGTGNTASSNLPVAVTTAGALAGKTPVAVAAGQYHNLALCADGTLAAWGSNSNCQLGNGTKTSSNVPLAVGTTGVLHGKTVIAVAAGENHNLALCSDGTLATWGYNYNGQLGIGNTASAGVPLAINSLGALSGKTVIAIAAGSYHSLALCADGTLAAWGSNSSGQLGNGGTTQSTVPVAVATVGALAGKTVVALTAGGSHSMALCSDGTLATWGYNGYGQLGDGSTTSSSIPVATSTLRVVPGGRFVAATSGQGANHSLGIIAEPPAPRIAVEQPAGTDLTNGTSTVDFGMSPVGTGGSRSITIKNTGTLDLTDIAVTFDGVNGTDFTLATPPATALVAGASTTLVVTFTPGSIATRNGTLHIESNDPIVGAFAVNLTGTAVGALEATYSTGLEAPLSADSITATGNTVNLRLNFAPTTGTTLTVAKNTGLAFIQGAFGNLAQGQAVALTFAGTTYNFVANYYGGTGNDLVLQWAATRLLAWGANASGMLGNNGSMQSTVPTGVDSDGILSGKTVAAVAAGAASTVALCADGKLAAWGGNIYGQLGNNSTTQSKVPIAVDQTGVLSGKTVIAIAAGGYHHLALCSDGTIAAWGRGVEGQLGANSPTNSLVPVAVSRAVGSALSNKAVVAVAAGAYHSLALCSDGTVVAWGYNQSGQLGDNTKTQRNVPVTVRMDMGTSALVGSKAIAVAAGSAHSLALCANGTLATWGNSSYGQLGDGSTGQSSVPVTVNAAWDSPLHKKSVTAVAAGQFHNLALCSDNTLVAWGLNENGQLGDTTTTQRNKPVAVNAIAGLSALSGRMVTAIAAGSRHSLALCADGVLTAWGSNSNGQLGDTTTTQRTVPVLVNTDVLPVGTAFVLGTSGQSAYHSLGTVADLLAARIAVECPAGVGLTDETSTVDFGQVASGGGSVRTFTLRNPGNATLDSLFIATDGTHADEFTVGPLGTTTLVPGAATTFAVTFSPAGLSVRTAALHIVSNVTGAANPFDIALTGTGTDLTQIKQWRMTYFQTTDNAGNAADTATPQNDGIVNLLKFATGMHPGQPGTMPGACTRSGDNLVFTYSRSKAAVIDGVTFTVEWSDSLASATWSHNGVSEADVDQGETHLVTATLPAGAGLARFVRLRVESK